MQLQEIKEVIASQREEIEEKFEKTKIIEREIDKERLKGFLKSPNILAILGVRRCGKSTLSLQLLRNEEYGYINFDDERIMDFNVKDFDKAMEAFYELYGKIENIILDEPHNIRGWELFVNRLRRTKKVIVTGSNSKMLSGELATHLTGRHIDFTLYPFSFREFLTYNDFEIGDYITTAKMGLIKNLLRDYFSQGGFPERYILGKEMLVNIYFDIVEKDIIRRIKIKKKVAFKEMVKYLVSNFSSEITFSKLKNVLDIKDQHTIKNWIDGLEQAYLIKMIERFSPKLKESMIAPRKVYCIDTGIIGVISFRLSENIGRVMENIVAIELLRRKSYWYPGMEIFYWKDYQGKEVDFLVKEGVSVKELIQVTYASGRDEIERREIKSLVKASDELKCKNLKIITWDYEDELKVDNKTIRCVPLWRWLLTV
ncbi:MAG: hypothetical protein DRJ99_02810 [Thermoplasmata archaeon]|nr:MAG: hypothetical protein DRJ99_02810 [Thermoplasmata archaeon]